MAFDKKYLFYFVLLLFLISLVSLVNIWGYGAFFPDQTIYNLDDAPESGFSALQIHHQQEMQFQSALRRSLLFTNFLLVGLMGAGFALIYSIHGKGK